MKKVLFLMVTLLGVCSLFLGHTTADYFVNTLTITAGDLNGTSIKPDFPVAFSPDGTLLASSSPGRDVVLWDTTTGAPVERLTVGPKRGASNAITDIVFSEDGDEIAAGDLNGDIYIWNVDGTRENTLEHGNSVLGVALGLHQKPDFSYEAAVISLGLNSLKRWTRADETVAETANITLPALAMVANRHDPEERYLREKRIVIGKTDGVLEIRLARNFGADWIFARTNAEDTISSRVTALESIGTFAFLSGHQNGKLGIWDTALEAIDGSTSSVWDLTEPLDDEIKDLPLAQQVTLHPDAVLALARGWVHRLASGSTDGEIRIWDLNIEADGLTVGSHNGAAYCVDYHKTDYTYIASGGADNKVRLWDRDTNTQRYALTGHTGAVTAVAYNSTGTQVASGSKDKTIRLWRNDTGAHIRTLIGHTQPVTDIVFDDSDDTYLWSCSRDGTVRKWDTSDGSHTVEVRTGHDFIALSLDPSSDSFAVAGDGRLYFYTPVGGNYEMDYLPSWRQVWDVDFDVVSSEPRGVALVTGEAYDRTVGLWQRVGADTNNDNQVTQADVDLVRSHWGKAIGDVPTNERGADVDGNGTVDHNDIAHVIAVLQNTPGAPAKHLPGEPLETQTALYANYPNPFNPETWIPYELATPAEVTVDIHSATGQLVRTLRLGYQPAGMYRAQTRAGYWDGRNGHGEPVASGVYFYTLKAGDFTATRKMLILK